MRRNKGNGKLWAATALVIFLFVFDLATGGRVRTVARVGAASLSRAVQGASASIAATGLLATHASLAAQNRALADQLAQYEARAALFTVVQAENDQLRSLTRLVRSATGISAPVVSSALASPYGTFLIGAGTADGVHGGSLVLISSTSSSEGFVVGVVQNAADHIATVGEAFAPSSSLSVVIHGNATALAGSGGGNARARIPRGAPVLVGDPVLVPEFGGRAVGIVGHIASSSAQASQDVYVRVPINLDSLQFVYVIPR